MLVMSVLVFPAAACCAQASHPAAPVLIEEPNWQPICKAALAEPLPAEAAALAEQAEAAASKPCDETRAYYGFGKPPDYPEALRCAYRHRAKPKPGDFIGGAGTLTMLYANGYGVPQNYPLAIRFACEGAGDAASAESELRIGRLEALRDGKLPHAPSFDLCQDATSGAMGSYCQEITERVADVGRARKLAVLRAKLPTRAQMLLPELEAAETAFEKARGQGEYTSGRGTGSFGFELSDQGELRDQFLINLRRFAAGDLAKATAADRVRAKQQMKAAAAAAAHFTPDANAGPMEPTPASLAATQHAWESLYATWMRFVPVAYPQLSPDAAATELLRLRIHQLKRAAQESGAP